MKKKLIVAIDGHSSCGKSTMAKKLAREAGYIYIDTGAMYRAVTLFAMKRGFFGNDGTLNAEALKAAMKEVEVTFRLDAETGLPLTCLCGECVEREIRTLEVSERVSPVAALPFVREAMTRQQQLMGRERGIVMDGRDIGTVVFPDAELKIFVTASAEVRAQRRYDELTAKGENVSYEDILKNVEERDYIDSHREVAPLRKADDALLLDNSDLTFDEQNAWLLQAFVRTLTESALQSVHYPERPEGLYEPIAYTLAGGGKRLRPSLMLLAYGLFRNDFANVLPAAVGLETYHNHTLLHDDLMDNAAVRRGLPTVHCKWDANTAILSGDTMLIMAFEHVMQCDCEGRTDLLKLFARTAREICEGQQYDMNFEQRNDVGSAEYLEMIRLKTSVLLACAAKCGAIAAGASEADGNALYRFAEHIGLAFQLQDDFLDVYGDPAVFGKKIGGDILCGKKTYLLTSALEKADEATHDRLLTLINDKGLPAEEKIAAVTEIYNRLDIPRRVNDAIEGFYNEARKHLDAVSVPKEKKQALWAYAESLLGRKV